MNPIFTVPYSEYAVAQQLKDKLNCSVFLPMSAQEKGIDLLLYKFENGTNKTIAVQVKNSRSYLEKGKYEGWNGLWFNSFEPQKNADWFILTGVYPNPSDAKDKVKIEWKQIFLALRYEEMKDLIDNLRQKKDNTKPDRMFGFRFNEKNNKIVINQTRGYHENGEDTKDRSDYLLDNRIAEMLADLG